MTSVILGATSLEQLQTAVEAVSLSLSDEVLAGIEAIHEEQPNAYLV